MYHPDVIARHLNRFEKLNGWRPEYHSIEEVEASVQHLNSLITETGVLARDLNKDEARFIENEQALCTVDFRYYATRYVWIKTWTKAIRRFLPNIAQEMMLQIWADLESQGRSISVQILKARQLGQSTLCEIAISHRVQFHKDVNAVVGSSDPDKSTQMASMILRVWDKMPWWLMPEKTRDNVGELIEFGRLGTRLSIQHGTQRHGIARGDTVQCYHLSECSEYSNPEEIVEAALDGATHETPQLLRLRESTAKGKGPKNWWHRTWLFNRDHYWKGESDFCPVFLPWYIGTDLYPTPTWLKSHLLRPDWKPAALTEKHAERAAKYVRGHPYLSKLMGKNWIMPRAQQWFWEIKRKTFEANGSLSKFYEEYPADDNEAFQSSGHSVFTAELIAERREGAKWPVGIYGIVGDQAEIPLLRTPDRRDIWATKDPIHITAKWANNRPAHEYQLIPLKQEGYPTMDFEGKLLLWEMPEDEMEYTVGVDTGYGIGQDRSVIQVIRKGSYYRNDAQVAEFASKWMGAMDIWPHVLAIATLFSTRIRGRVRQAKVVVECAANGEMTQHEIRKHGWSHLHPWVRYDKKKIQVQTALRWGWYTTAWSRPMMLEQFIAAVRDGWLDVNSPELINEMASLEADGPRGKLEAALGENDDRVMGTGIAFFSSTILENRGARQDMSQARRKAVEEARSAPQWNPGWQGMDQLPKGFDHPETGIAAYSDNDWAEIKEKYKGNVYWDHSVHF